MPRPNESALDKATERILRIAAKRRAAGLDTMPTIRELRSLTGYSHVTVWKAVRQLTERGVLRTVRGHAIRILPSSADTDRDQPVSSARRVDPTPAPTTAWSRLADDLERGLLIGTYPPGMELPSSKELAASYGMSARTIARALDSLRRRGLVQPHGRGYRPRELMRPLDANTVVLVQRAPVHAESAGSTDYRTHDFFRALEHECARAGLALKVASLPQLHEHGALPNRLDEYCREQWGVKTVLGYLLRTVGMRQDQVADVLLSLAHTGKPGASLSETARIDHASLPHAGPLLTRFTMAHSARAGEDMGRYLLSLGHRNVAYLSASHGNAFSRNRLAGLRTVYARAGLTHAVKAFTTDRTRNEYRGEPDGQARASLNERVQRVVRHARTDDRQLARALADLRADITITLAREQVRSALLPLFNEAIAHTDLTAWVGATDVTALHCQAWLNARNVSTPERLSVVGFDDTVEASMARLTSYNFNIPAAVQAMVRQVVGPERVRRGRSDGPREIEGFVAQRGSSGEARGH